MAPDAAYSLNSNETTFTLSARRQRSGSGAKTSPMSWLRISSPTSPPPQSSGSLRISEPKLIPASHFAALQGSRIGHLGGGAKIIRTVAEAWDEIPPQVDHHSRFASVPDSPTFGKHRVPLTPPREREVPLRPIRPPPLAPLPPPLTKTSPGVYLPSSEAEFLPILTDSSPYFSPIIPREPFSPILLSPAPKNLLDPSQVVVSIETSTCNFKSTLATLRSRPSRLEIYLDSLFSTPGSSSQPSSPTSFTSIFHNHLKSQGLLSPSSTLIHIFLDRPSAPYHHILSYLRSSSPILPRAVQFHPSFPSRLEALLELRDEARYLELDELYLLCCDEINHFARAFPGKDISVPTPARVNTSVDALPTQADKETIQAHAPHVDRVGVPDRPIPPLPVSDSWI